MLLNPAYIIQSPNIEVEDAELWIHISDQGLAFIVFDNTACTLLIMYHFSEKPDIETSASQVRKIFTDKRFLKQSFKKVHIVYRYAASILVPHEYLNESVYKSMLELVYGDATETLIHVDFMYRYNLHNVYSVPKEIEKALAHFFPFATHTHLYSLLPGVLTKAGDHLYCVFYGSQVTAMLIRDRKLKLVQNYVFKTPVDVAYHLLNLCKSFKVEIEQTTLNLSGMIEETSALYEELNKYFLHISFESLPWQFQYPDQIKNYPDHFFSHLFQISACV